MIDWILQHWDTIFAVIGIIGTVCSAIVKAFSRFKWAETIVKICDRMSVFNTAENKEKIAKYNEKK